MGQTFAKITAVLLLAAFALPAQAADTVKLRNGHVTITPPAGHDQKVILKDDNTKLTIYTDEEGAKALRKVLKNSDRIVLHPGTAHANPLTYYPYNYYPYYSNVSPGYGAGYATGAIVHR